MAQRYQERTELDAVEVELNNDGTTLINDTLVALPEEEGLDHLNASLYVAMEYRDEPTLLHITTENGAERWMQAEWQEDDVLDARDVDADDPEVIARWARPPEQEEDDSEYVDPNATFENAEVLDNPDVGGMWDDPQAYDKSKVTMTSEGAMALTEDVKKQRRRIRNRRLASIGAGLLAVVLAVVITIIFVTRGDDSSLASQIDTPLTTAMQDIEGAPAGDIVPGYETSPEWEYEVPSGAKLGISSVALSYTTSDNVVLIDPDTGKNILKEPVDDSVTFIIDAYVGDQLSVVWNDGDHLKVWSEGSKVTSHDLPKGARLSDSGEQVMVTTDSDRYVLEQDGLTKITVPEGVTPLGVDRGGVISAGAQGPLVVSSPEGTESSRSAPEAPEEGMYVTRWISSGFGKSVVAWTNNPDTAEDTTPTTVAIHDAATGKIISSFDTEYGQVKKGVPLERGQGKQLAHIAGVVFNLNSGELILDARQSQSDVDAMNGNIITGTGPEGEFMAQGEQAWAADTAIIAQTSNGNVVMESKKGQIISLRPAGPQPA